MKLISLLLLNLFFINNLYNQQCSTPVVITQFTEQNQFCEGDTIFFDQFIDSSFFHQSVNSSDTLYIKDTLGVVTQQTITISGSNNLTIDSVEQLLNICLHMEHSFVGDLDIKIICPNGQESSLLIYDSLNPLLSVLAGNPVDGDNPPIPGEGWAYCFTNSLTDHSNEFTPGQSPEVSVLEQA